LEASVILTFHLSECTALCRGPVSEDVLYYKCIIFSKPYLIKACLDYITAWLLQLEAVTLILSFEGKYVYLTLRASVKVMLLKWNSPKSGQAAAWVTRLAVRAL
jgi:hypothetical protein